MTGSSPEQKSGGLFAAAMGGLALVGLVLLMTRGAPLPSPKPASAPETEFSAERAHEFLEEICREPHHLGSPELRRVRGLIVNRLVDLGLEPRVQERIVDYRWWPTGAIREAELANIWVRVRGEHNDRLGALFVCHYDSREGSPGATDDGAAVASFLETIRALQTGPPLPRSIAFLFTDGEEAGLLGAKAFLSEEEEGEWGRRRDEALIATAVFNFEGIGNAGPSILFETAEDSGGLIGTLLHALPRVYASALGPTVYERMPNDTDFSVFKEKGVRGLNFAVVGGKAAYHAPFDTPSNQPLGVLQCQGDTVLGLAREFGGGGVTSYLQSLPSFRGGERVFFDLFGFGFVHYSSEFNVMLGIVALAILLGAMFLQLRRHSLTWRELIRGCFEFFLISLFLGGAALGLWLYFRMQMGWFLDLVPVEERRGDALSAWLGLAGQITSACALGILLLSTLTAGNSLPRFAERRAAGIFLGGGFTVALLLIAALIEAPNGSYLLTWPLGALGLAMMVSGRASRFSWPILLLGALSLLIPTFATLVQLFSVHGAFPAYLGAAGIFLIAPYLLPLLYQLSCLSQVRRVFMLTGFSGVILLNLSALLRLQGM